MCLSRVARQATKNCFRDGDKNNDDEEEGGMVAWYGGGGGGGDDDDDHDKPHRFVSQVPTL